MLPSFWRQHAGDDVIFSFLFPELWYIIKKCAAALQPPLEEGEVRLVALDEKKQLCSCLGSFTMNLKFYRRFFVNLNASTQIKKENSSNSNRILVLDGQLTTSMALLLCEILSSRIDCRSKS